MEILRLGLSKICLNIYNRLGILIRELSRTGLSNDGMVFKKRTNYRKDFIASASLVYWDQSVRKMSLDST